VSLAGRAVFLDATALCSCHSQFLLEMCRPAVVCPAGRGRWWLGPGRRFGCTERGKAQTSDRRDYHEIGPRGMQGRAFGRRPMH
jgi:hypothetical protein